MKLHLLAALLAATLLAACGFDATPQSSGSTASPAAAPAAESAPAAEQPAEGEKKAD
jgi:hypothetical protein